GTEVVIRDPDFEGEVFQTPGGREMFIPTQEMQMDPSHAKGAVTNDSFRTQYFFNRKTGNYDPFHNPLGMTMARQMGVMLVQSLDGDLVKWTNIVVNKGRQIPRPAIWVHDSFISTPGPALIYHNAYNNIAIRESIAEMKKIGKKLDQALKHAKLRD